MDRILLLMTAHCYQDAHEALESAREQAAAPERLTYGLSLAEEPIAEENAAMHALARPSTSVLGGTPGMSWKRCGRARAIS